MTPGLLDLNLSAWAERFRRPEALLERAQALAALAAPGSLDEAWSALHATLGLRAAGRRDEAGQALTRAGQGFVRHGHAAGQRVCDALHALPLVAAGRSEEALAKLGDPDGGDFEANFEPDVDPRSAAGQRALRAHAAQFYFWARAMARSAAGRWDDALRDRYTSVQHARATGDDAAIAHALADLAAVQADLCNAEDALTLATEAQVFGERAGHSLGWAMAVFNRLAALLSLQRDDEAVALARQLLPHVDGLNPRNRESACLLLGRALLRGGDAATAERLLQRSLHERVVGHVTECALLQAELLMSRGDWAAASTLCTGFLAADDSGRRASGPDELMLLHRAASRACEQVGDATGALHHSRAEQHLLAAVLGRGAQARRLALEIEHRLDQERVQREQAQQRQRAAESERERVDELNRALAAANQAKTRFLAAASHDLRQPVQALAMNMAALQGEQLTPPQGRLVGRMAQSLDALSRMFDVLLDISRLDAGIVPVHPEALALRPLLHRLVDEHLVSAAAGGLQLRLRLPSGLPAVMTRSDPALLERCLRNVLDNALKYTRHGGVLVAVRAVAGDASGDGASAETDRTASAWLVEIVDTGIGMTAAEQARVFEEFYQAGNPERDRGRGLGLGGAIVLRLCQLLGHPLQLRSRPGRGTRVSLRLPAIAEPAAVRDAPGRLQPGPSAALCLMVIDDDADVRDSLVTVLARWGHAVLAGVDPPDVLHQWHRAGRPAVQGVLCDLRLRGTLDGVAAVAELRLTLGHRLPALVVTGDIAPERLQRLRDSGLPWLAKPVMPMRLRSWLAGVEAGATDAAT